MTRKKNASDSPFPDSDALLAATFALVAEKGIGKTRLTAIAKQLDLPVAQLYAHYPSVNDIFFHFIDRADQAMLAVAASAAKENPPKRDLYFDMMMARFDLAQEYREGVARWLGDLPHFPQLWLATLRRWDQSLSLMLDLAQDSPLLPLKKAGLAGIYAATLRSWLRDDSADMAQTMVTLDRMLEKGGNAIERLVTRRKMYKTA